MNKAKHTPAPWKVFYATNNDQLIIGVGQETGEGIIASNGSFWGTDAEAKANAEHVVKCVNAHDSLLDALELVKSQLEKDYITMTNDVEGAVYDAIKEAKGES